MKLPVWIFPASLLLMASGLGVVGASWKSSALREMDAESRRQVQSASGGEGRMTGLQTDYNFGPGRRGPLPGLRLSSKAMIRLPSGSLAQLQVYGYAPLFQPLRRVRINSFGLHAAAESAERSARYEDAFFLTSMARQTAWTRRPSRAADDLRWLRLLIRKGKVKEAEGELTRILANQVGGGSDQEKREIHAASSEIAGLFRKAKRVDLAKKSLDQGLLMLDAAEGRIDLMPQPKISLGG